MTPSFLNSENIASMRDACWTKCSWDFSCALGDTMAEKFESAYVKLVELTNVLIARGAKGYFWCVMSPELSSMFTTVKMEFTMDQMEMGIEGVTEMGILNRRWRMFVDNSMSEHSNTILVGCGLNDTPDPKHVGRINVCNYVI